MNYLPISPCIIWKFMYNLQRLNLIHISPETFSMTKPMGPHQSDDSRVYGILVWNGSLYGYIWQVRFYRDILIDDFFRDTEYVKAPLSISGPLNLSFEGCLIGCLISLATQMALFSFQVLTTWTIWGGSPSSSRSRLLLPVPTTMTTPLKKMMMMYRN